MPTLSTLFSDRSGYFLKSAAGDSPFDFFFSRQHRVLNKSVPPVTSDTTEKSQLYRRAK